MILGDSENMPLNNSFDAITVAFGVETLKLSKSLLKY
jgi:ubiquinone/menaquinone biosynthesis C-methylase UbiE